MIDIGSRSFNLSLVFLIAINMLPHIFEYTLPVLLVGGACIIWRVLFEYQKVKLPVWPVKLVFVVVCLAAVYSQYGTIFGLEAGTAGIIMGVSLKLIDRNTYHDAMVVLFLVFIVLLTQVLKSQTLWITIFAVFDVIIITGLLLQIHSHKDLSFNPVKLLTTGTKLFLKAAPLMVLLFVVFPRLSYKLNILPGGDGSAKSGFSDSLDPGGISSLALSDKVAFRSEIIKGKVPSPADMYWRGATLVKNTNGLKWKTAKKLKGRKYKSNIVKGTSREPKNNDIVQKILLPARYNDWLFALDVPSYFKSEQDKPLAIMYQNNIGYFMKSDNETYSIFIAHSNLKSNMSLDIKEKNTYTQVPKQISSKVMNLVSELKNETTSVEQFSAKLLKHYQEGYNYTLKPPKLSVDQLEDFLLNTKKGFCEHFAASFSTLVRLAGYPARVVVGFQGGEINKYDGLITIKDKDAHAWAEVWSESKGQWLRYDPTQVVAPLRITLGGQAYHEMINDILNSNKEDESYWLNEKSKTNLLWLNQLDQLLVTASTRWTRFLSEYDRTKQIKIFDKIGIKNIRPAFLIIISLISFIMFYFWIKVNVFKRKKISLIDKCLNSIYMSLEKLKFDKKWNEGPETYFNRLGAKYPEQKSEINDLKNVLLVYKYSDQGCNKDEVNQVKLKFKKLKNKLH